MFFTILLMCSLATIGSDDLFANFRRAYAALLKVVSHDCLAYTDAAVLTVLGFEAAVQTLVTVTLIAVAITR